jgi:hypothetical protein
MQLVGAVFMQHLKMNQALYRLLLMTGRCQVFRFGLSPRSVHSFQNPFEAIEKLRPTCRGTLEIARLIVLKAGLLH